MRNPLFMLAAILAGSVAAGCGQSPGAAPIQAKTMYALKNGVAFRAGSTAVVKSLQYGESVRVQQCDSTTCSAPVGQTMATVNAAELSDRLPPMGSRYVWGHFGDLKPNQQVTIQAYNPLTNSLEVDGEIWIDAASLQARPETIAEARIRQKADAVAKAEREKAEAIAEAAQAKQRRAEVKEERERLKVAAIESENDRRAFARQLRDKYLATGADIKVTVSGSHAQRLSLEYPLINDVWLYQFQHNEEAMSALRAKGFTQLDLSDGWNYGKRLRLD